MHADNILYTPCPVYHPVSKNRITDQELTKEIPRVPRKVGLPVHHCFSCPHPSCVVQPYWQAGISSAVLQIFKWFGSIYLMLEQCFRVSSFSFIGYCVYPISSQKIDYKAPFCVCLEESSKFVPFTDFWITCVR